MLARFIHRTVLVVVVSLIMVSLGLLARIGRPVSQFPPISDLLNLYVHKDRGAMVPYSAGKQLTREELESPVTEGDD